MTGVLPWLVPAAVAVTGAVVALLGRRGRARALPLADARALGPAARRTALLRLALATCLVALLGFAAGLVGRTHGGIAGLLASGSSTVVVLDMSASVSDLVYQEIARMLKGIADTAGDDERVGLVLFSDVAEEALPPGTRAAELRPFIRYFLPRPEPGVRRKPPRYQAAGPGAPPEVPYPLNPWFRTFSGGTRISTGLAAARRSLQRDARGRGNVILLSDLGEAQEDASALTGELLTYARTPGIRLSVVALPPAGEGETAPFRTILGGRASVLGAAELTHAREAGGAPAGRVPLWLVVVAALLGAALAVNELALRPLAWRGRLGGEVSG